MKKLRLKSLASSLLMFTTAYSMESPSSIKIETIPDELKLSILTAQNNQKEALLQYTDIIKLMQTNKYFNEFTKNGELWVFLSRQNGFATHPNTAFKCHYNYLKGLKLNLRNPEFKNTALLEESIQCFNKGAPYMHEGAIYKLRELMNSPHVPLETKCIYVPKDLNLETCAFLSEDQILEKSDDEFLELVSESNFDLIKNSEKIRARVFNLLKNRDLNILIEILNIGLQNGWGDDANPEELKTLRESLFSNLEIHMPKILGTLEKAKENKDFITIDLIISLLDTARDINEDSDESWDSNDESESQENSNEDPLNVTPVLTDLIQFVTYSANPAQIAKMTQFLEYISENELNYEGAAVRKNPEKETPTPFRNAVLSIIMSGHIKPSHYFNNSFFHNLGYRKNGINILNDYFYFMEKELAMSFPSLFFHDNPLGYMSIHSTHIDYGSPLTLRKFIKQIELSKINVTENIFIKAIKSVVNIGESHFSQEFCQKHFGFDNYLDFRTHLLGLHQQKFLELSETLKEKDELFTVYGLLTQSYEAIQDHDTALKYANLTYRAMKHIYIDESVTAETLMNIFIRANDFDKAEGFLKYLPEWRNKHTLEKRLTDAKNAQ